MTETKTNLLTVNSAVINAMQFVKELYKNQKLEDVLLEEVEFSESSNQWLVTIGFTINKEKDNSSSLILSKRETERKYKVVHIDAQSGEFISMKIREI